MNSVMSLLPERAKTPVRQAKNVLRTIRYSGNNRHCSVCGKNSGRFDSFGVVPREDARCVHCSSLERHRFLWLYLQSQTDLFNGNAKKMLHVAPEWCFEAKFKEQLGDAYLTADLNSPTAMVKMDICDIQYPEHSFDVIYCAHVLEHVPDDKQAMREFYRVLKNDGWAILNVPISTDKTFEDPSVVDPEERLRVFGQHDHMRIYGPDYADRLREAGFTVKVCKVEDLVNTDDAKRMGLTPACGEIYYCTKKADL